ncbi:hypothetical protein [Flindersiella endophytica]
MPTPPVRRNRGDPEDPTSLQPPGTPTPHAGQDHTIAHSNATHTPLSHPAGAKADTPTTPTTTTTTTTTPSHHHTADQPAL